MPGDRIAPAGAAPIAQQFQREGAGVVRLPRTPGEPRDPRRGLGRPEPEVRGQSPEGDGIGLGRRVGELRQRRERGHHALVVDRPRGLRDDARLGVGKELGDLLALELAERQEHTKSNGGDVVLCFFASVQTFHRSTGLRAAWTRPITAAWRR